MKLCLETTKCGESFWSTCGNFACRDLSVSKVQCRGAARMRPKRPWPPRKKTC